MRGEKFEFSPAGYINLIGSLQAQGYTVRGFDNAQPDRRDLILRHDIDVSIDEALSIARLEAEAGVSATYFVLLRCERYNPFTPAGHRALSEIQELGHTIGLHFDAALYGDDIATLDAAAAREYEILETIIETPVQILSFHRPAPSLLGYQSAIAGRNHSYQPRFFHDMGYCSDSGGRWRHGPPLDHAAVKLGCALQLLTHPVWWTGANEDVTARLDRLIDAQIESLRRGLASEIKTYQLDKGN